MTNISKFPNRRVIEEEAYDWLVKLDRDEPPSREDLEALREWLSRSPVHRQVLNSLNAFWSNNILTELMVPLGRHEARAGFFTPLRRSFRSRAALTATAGAVIVVIALAIWFSSARFTMTNGLYVTAVGQQKTVRLADGSTIELNTNSQIQVQYTDQYRRVRLLQGEAYFKVARNVAQPFLVYAGAGRIEAMGTAFIVSLGNETAVEVLVTEGRVALAAIGTSKGTADPPRSQRPVPESGRNEADFDPYVNSPLHELVVIEAAQSITLDAAGNSEDGRREVAQAIKEIDADELARRQSWRTGLLVFEGEPLEQVVREVSRYTTVSIEIVDPELRRIPIGGRFRVGQIDEMFLALEANFGLEVNWLNYNQVQLKAK